VRSEPASPTHATPEELARFLDRRLDPRARARLAEHLAECATCRSDLVRAGRVIRQPGVTGRLIGAAAVTVALIAAVVGIVSKRGGDTGVLRGADRAAALIAYGPIGQIDSLRPRFTWGAASPGTLYRLSVFDRGGTPLWTISVRDTTTVLPSDRSLTRGGSYTWIVDALRSDGSELSTGLRQFQIGP